MYHPRLNDSLSDIFSEKNLTALGLMEILIYHKIYAWVFFLKKVHKYDLEKNKNKQSGPKP